MGYDSDQDEQIALSSHALDALKEFYAEKDAVKAKFEDLKVEAEKQHAAIKEGGEVKEISIHDFGEDWQESQFWYSDECAGTIARQLLDGASSEDTIVAVSAPSVFVALRNAVVKRGPSEPKPKLVLLEYDRRFAVFPEFVFYDYNSPVRLPASLKGVVDRVAVDPPFLNEDCQTKEALTVRWLCKGGEEAKRIVLCTGERMETLVTTKLYKSLGLRTTTFEPEHANKLSNEFFCYANFECGDWTWREDRQAAPAS